MNGESETRLLGLERGLEACRGNKKGRVAQAKGIGWTKDRRCRKTSLASLCAPAQAPSPKLSVAQCTAGVNTRAQHGLPMALALALRDPQ